MTKADFTITHIFRENPTAQKWFGALHGVNLLKRRKTIKEDKHMNTEIDGGVYRSGGMERRIHSGIYRRAVPEPEAEERFKEEKEPVHKRGELWE